MNETIKSRSNFQKVFHRFFSRKLAVFGLIIVAAILLFAVFGSFVCQFTFDETNTPDRYQAPNSIHWFGTDDLGRDIFARVVDAEGCFRLQLAGVGAWHRPRSCFWLYWGRIG